MLQSIHNKSDRPSNFVPGLAPRGNGGRSPLLRLGRSAAMATCEKCGKQFEPSKNSQGRFCSRKCSTSFLFGKDPITIICEVCGKPLLVKPAIAKRGRKYCSIECFRSRSLDGKKQCICAFCGVEYTTWKCRSNGKRTFCSMQCAREWLGANAPTGAKSPNWKGGEVSRKCLFCKAEFTIKPNKLKRGWGKFCSVSCMAKSRTGEKNGRWNGGTSFEPYSPEWTPKLKEQIRKRDGHSCALCLADGNQVHHIDYNKKNCSADNLITLCRSCHSKTNTRRAYWKSLFSKTGAATRCST